VETILSMGQRNQVRYTYNWKEKRDILERRKRARII
jgi:hypothetical protein